MPTGSQGSIRLFQFKGIDVFLHWSWFLVAVFEINGRAGRYSSIAWNVVEYLALFLIVLLHEFGHALACRQVGGNANRIVLWPLGGVAYVDPPPRPGATLWSIAAGPLVNVALAPLLYGLVIVSRSSGWAETMPNQAMLLESILYIDVALLLFNILPIYPLDGGQILRAFLWFFMGRARSLMTATVIGFIGVAGIIFLAWRSASTWLAVISLFILWNCWIGLKQAMALLRMAKIPRRHGYHCPWCKAEPPLGNGWTCGHCQNTLDIFETQGVCPHCSARFGATRCMDCGKANPLAAWSAAAYEGAAPESKVPTY